MNPRRTSAGSSGSGSYSLQSYDSQSPEKRRNSEEDVSYLSDDYEYSPRNPILRAPDAIPRSERLASSVLAAYRYRVPNRVMRYLCLGLAASILVFMLSLVRASVNSTKALVELNKEGNKEAGPEPPRPWEAFPFLRRYHGGLRTLVNKAENMAEFPRKEGQPLTELLINSDQMHPVPQSEEYHPYPDYKSQEYIQEFGEVRDCFLDDQNTIRPPKVRVYHGVPAGMPEQAYGSYETLGLNNTICLDRYGRYGPYGYGYSKSEGGIGAGVEGERGDQEKIDYSKIDWGTAQRRCAQKNAHRFKPSEKKKMPKWSLVDPRAEDASEVPSWRRPFPDSDPSGHSNDEHHGLQRNTSSSASASEPGSGFKALHKLPRQAVIVRTWSDFDYRDEHILYLRSMISELSIASGGEFDVFLLVHVKNMDAPIWADEDAYQKMLEDSLPAEFRSIGVLWSESQIESIYRGVHDELDRPGFPPILGVYRSLHLSLAYFSKTHPEYEYIWNFEMDIRYIGNWYNLFTRVGSWAASQPRKGLWERNHRFYVPEIHGSWEEFSQMVRYQSEMPAQENPSRWANIGPNGEKIEEEPYIDEPVWGPQWAEGDLAAAPFDDDPVPPTDWKKDKYEWGVGEEADLILFQPIFDPARTDWTIQRDFSGYNLGEDGTKGANPPRRVTIVAAGRLSRRLLDRMHRETALRKHSMFTEMFPPSMALHHGMKAVFAPHPVYIDRDWPLKYLTATYNSGPKGVTGRHKGCVFGDCCQHNLLGVTWHYNAGFAGDLYKRWWGLKVNNDGGEAEEAKGEGRMCLPTLLFHPVKDVDISPEAGS